MFRGERRFWIEDREANGGGLSYLDQQRQLELQMAAQHQSLVDNPHAAKFRDSSTTGTGTGSFDEEQGMVHHDVVDIELDLDMDGDRDRDGEDGRGITRPQRSYSASYVRGRPTGVRRGSSARGVGKEKSQVKVTVDEVDLDADSTSDERRRHDRYLKDQSLASSSSSSSS